jgi:hypothetical protein
MDESAEAFYDELAASYHLIFEDWNRSIATQAAVIGPLLERYTAPGLALCSGLCLRDWNAEHRISPTRSYCGRFGFEQLGDRSGETRSSTAQS